CRWRGRFEQDAGTVGLRLRRHTPSSWLGSGLHPDRGRGAVAPAPAIVMGTLKGFPNPPAMLRGEQSSPAPHAISKTTRPSARSIAGRVGNAGAEVEIFVISICPSSAP